MVIAYAVTVYVFVAPVAKESAAEESVQVVHSLMHRWMVRSRQCVVVKGIHWVLHKRKKRMNQAVGWSKYWFV